MTNADVPDKNVGDTISRKAAIAVADSSDYVGLSVEDVKKVTDEVVKGLKRLPSAQPEDKCGECDAWNQYKNYPRQQWTPCSKPPETDENVFIARGNENFMSCCIGHYDLDAETWYEDRNWFAQILYDALYWCKMPTLPEPYKEKDNAMD